MSSPGGPTAGTGGPSGSGNDLGLPNWLIPNSVANTITGGPGNNNGLAQQTAAPIASAITAVGGAVGALTQATKFFTLSTLNILLNNLVYAAIAAIGLYMFFKGLNMIVSEVPGAAGVRNVVTAPVHAVGRVAKKGLEVAGIAALL